MDAFADTIFKLSFLHEKADILIKMSPQWVPATYKQEVGNGLNKKGLAPGYHPNQCWHNLLTDTYASMCWLINT